MKNKHKYLYSKVFWVDMINSVLLLFAFILSLSVFFILTQTPSDAGLASVATPLLVVPLALLLFLIFVTMVFLLAYRYDVNHNHPKR